MTALLVAANIVVWVYMLTLVEEPQTLSAFYRRWAFDPVAQLGALARGQLSATSLLPLLTHQFLHAGWLHIGGNMLFLWVFGGAVEDRIGHVMFLVFYLLAGCVAALTEGLILVTVLSPDRMVGASGAISGVLGAYFVLAPTARVRTLVTIGVFTTVLTLPAILILGEWIVLQVVSALGALRIVGEDTANVAYFAHLGGFATGLVVAGAAKLVARVRRRNRFPPSPLLNTSAGSA